MVGVIGRDGAGWGGNEGVGGGGVVVKVMVGDGNGVRG